MDAKPCAFCDRKNLEERLIAEDDHFYVVATLGQITDGGYVIIIPKQHSRCIGEMNETDATALLLVAEYTRDLIKKTYGTEVMMCEHGIVGQTVPHTHLHLIPADLDIAPRIGEDFPNAATETLISLRDLPRLYAIASDPYLLWKSPGGPYTVAWNPPDPKPQYLRIVAAEMLGRPERANWRTMDPALDKKLGQETVARLKPHYQSPGRQGNKRSRR